MGERASTIDALQRELLDVSADERARLTAIRRLLELAAEPGVREALLAGAAAPPNARLLPVIVRSLGYLAAREVRDDLIGFLDHAQPAVAANALRALAERDAVDAVQLSLPLLMGSVAERAASAAMALVEKARAVADPAMARLARSPHMRERLAAYVYYRALPPDERVHAVLAALDVETDAELFTFLLGLLKRSGTQIDPRTQEATRDRFSRRAERLKSMIAQLPLVLPPAPPTEPRRQAPTPPAPAPAPVGVLEGLASGLVDRGVDERSRLELVRRVVEHAGDARAVAVLSAAADAAVNATIKHVIVRSLGYLRTPGVWNELARYTSDCDESVASNALKAAAAIDPERAVSLALPSLRGADPARARMAALVLVERCRPEADSALLPLADGHDPEDRVAGLTYLHALPAAVSRPAVLERLQREADPDLFEHLLKLVPRVVSRSEAGQLEQTIAKIEQRGIQVTQTLSQSGIPTGRDDETDRGIPPCTAAPATSPPAPPVADGANETEPADARERPEPDPPSRRGDVRARLEELVPPPASPSGAASTMLLIQAQLTRPMRWALAVLGVAALVGMVVVLRAPDTPKPVRSAPGLAVHQLGKTGDTVTFRGEVLRVHPEEKAVIVRVPDGTSAIVVVDSTARLNSLGPGMGVEVHGRIVAIRGPQDVVLSGTAVPAGTLSAGGGSTQSAPSR